MTRWLLVLGIALSVGCTLIQPEQRWVTHLRDVRYKDSACLEIVKRLSCREFIEQQVSIHMRLSDNFHYMSSGNKHLAKVLFLDPIEHDMAALRDLPECQP
jgi:hypothetical protein